MISFWCGYGQLHYGRFISERRGKWSSIYAPHLMKYKWNCQTLLRDILLKRKMLQILLEEEFSVNVYMLDKAVSQGNVSPFCTFTFPRQPDQSDQDSTHMWGPWHPPPRPYPKNFADTVCACSQKIFCSLCSSADMDGDEYIYGHYIVFTNKDTLINQSKL